MANQLTPPPRPGYGSRGRSIQATVNHFLVKNFPKNEIFNYEVAISPQVFAGIGRQVFESFLKDNQNALKQTWHDGLKNIYSCKLLTFGDLGIFEVTLPRRGELQTYKVELKLKRINMKEPIGFLNSENGFTSDCAKAIQALDTYIRPDPSLNLIRSGASFFVPEDSPIRISGGIELWTGFRQSVRFATGKLTINIDVCTGAFYRGPLSNIMSDILRQRDFRNGINNQQKAELEYRLKGVEFSVTHLQNRRYKFVGLASVPARNDKFPKDGQQIDVVTYFKDQYDLDLRYPHLPCVVVSNNSHIPIEVCRVEGYKTNKLNDEQKAQMIRQTCQKPYIRANKIYEGYRLLNDPKKPNLQSADRMLSVTVHVLNPPTIKCRLTSVKPDPGVWNMSGHKLFQGARLDSWLVVVFDQNQERPHVRKSIEDLARVCKELGMSIQTTQPSIVYANPSADIGAQLKKEYTSCKVKPQLIVCIVPNKEKRLHRGIKRAGETAIGVVTQCLLSSKLAKSGKVYYTNVCLKMNIKLGGINFVLDPGQMPYLETETTIVMGADVVHPSPEERFKPSVAAVCASVDPTAATYVCSIGAQRNDRGGAKETIVNIGSMVKELLQNFEKKCGKKPKRIIFFRDGVGEGHFRELLDKEIVAIKDACRELGYSHEPALTYIVVQKRHHTRGFPDKRNADRSGNLPAGSVIDNGITHPSQFDFFLQSHSGIQGTSRSSHYHVLVDEYKFQADELYQFVYNLCYTYARSTRSVSIVPPVYYADIICERALSHLADLSGSNDYLHPVKEGIKNVMWYM